MNRRTRRRLIVLGIVGGTVIAAGVGGTAVRKLQRERLAETSLTEGLAAYEAGDYPLARRKLGTHLRIKGPQAEALTALGDAQRHVVEPNGKHLIAARSYLDRAIELDPENDKAREILLDIHAQLGNWRELAQRATELLERQPANARFARNRIEAHLQRNASEDALEAARAFVEAQEGSIESHLEMLRVYRRLQRNARLQREYIEQEVAPQHEGTTSLAVLRASVEFDAGRVAEATDLLTQAAESGPTEGSGARMLLEATELIAAVTRNWSLYDQSQTWLVRWLEDDAMAPSLSVVAAGRAWRDGDPQGAVDHALRALNTTPETEAVFAWGVLGAIDLGYDAEASELRAAFEDLVTDEDRARAEGWRMVFTAAERRAAGLPADEQPLVSDGAMVSNMLGPDAVAVYYDALADIDRDNMLDAADRLSRLGQQPSWRRARFMFASTLVLMDRVEDALRVFSADDRLDDVPGGSQLISEIVSRIAEKADNLGPQFAERIDEVLTKQPENPIALAMAGRFAVATRDLEFAVELGNRLAETEAAQAAMSAIQFAAGLEPFDPAVARAVVDRIAETATTAPQVAAAASGLAILGDAAAGRALLEQRAGDPEGGTEQQWALARVQLANTIDDAQSLETLDRISSAYPGDQQIQLAILNSPVIWNDLDRAGLVINRLREAQGDAGIEGRIFEARRLLERDDSAEGASAAVALLGEVFRTDRGKRDTRAFLLAADAYERLGPLESELDALRRAADGNDPLAALPRLILRLQNTGRANEAATLLRKFADQGNVSLSQRQVRLRLLDRQGMQDLASRDVAALADAGVPRYVLRAGVETRAMGSGIPLREDEIAALQVELPPEAEIFAARLLARVGRFDEGLERLQALPAESDAGKRQLVVARFLAEHERTDAAVQYLVAEAEASNDIDLWQEAARLLVGAERIDEAVAVLDQGISALPESASLTTFRDSITQSGEMSPFTRMARFAASTGNRDDADPGMAELSAIADRYVKGDIDLVQAAAQLDELSKRRATLYPVWPLIIAAYEELNQPQRAVQRARDAVGAMPGDARPARDATQLLFRLESYDDAAGMADRWRSLAQDAKGQADASIALGIAEFRRGNIGRAINLLQPLSDQMLADPVTNAIALQTLIESLTLNDQMAAAGDLLDQLPGSEARWAEFKASMAAVAPPNSENVARAKAWLEQVEPRLADSATGVATLASSWMSLANRTSNPEFANYAIAMAESAKGTERDTWQLRAILATALEATGAYEQAVAAYEQAMQMAGRRIPALLNNAAWLLTNHLGEHTRAITMAREAIVASQGRNEPTGNLATYHHTLGMALLATGDAQGALRAFDSGLRIASTTSLRLGRIEALVANEQQSEARLELNRLRPDSTWTKTNADRYEALQRVLGTG
ncbi:hypothetical protein AY599_18805 [Leptolyngbya valderiana BDU 20041]|nr:hypothetical protein AY599_18805 [Leptolyngbya valderiana BDU 20041]